MLDDLSDGQQVALSITAVVILVVVVAVIVRAIVGLL
jgi:hypothetical protein